MRFIKDYIKNKPVLYDVAIRIRNQFTSGTVLHHFLADFSVAHNGHVGFIQIGANDGLRNDPVREFIVADRWTGILVEPLPTVFLELKNNYRHVNNHRLVFVNAAISSSTATEVSFWSFDEQRLKNLQREERLDLLRKSSFAPEHLRENFGDRPDFASLIKEVRVPCLTITGLMEKYWRGGSLHLIVIDAEGHEPTIFRSIDFSLVSPEAFLFESCNLGGDREEVFGILSRNGYGLSTVGGDTIALKTSLTSERYFTRTIKNRERSACRLPPSS